MTTGEPSATSTSASLPDRARVVVVGGGIIGCSVAYHLAHMGWKDVVLLERDRLTSGTTWHAAGLMVTFGSTSETSTEMRKYTRDLYARLEARPASRPASSRSASSRSRPSRPPRGVPPRVGVQPLLRRRRARDLAAKVKDLFPLARTDDILAGFYVKEDGRANPVDVTMSLAKGARMQGATIIEGVPVTGFLHEARRRHRRAHARGDIEAEYVVNCAGMWARQLGAKAGVNIPLQSAEHYYLITEKIAGLSAASPGARGPGSYGYFREEVGGLMVGLFEPVCAPWKVGGVPRTSRSARSPPTGTGWARTSRPRCSGSRSRSRSASGSSSAARRASRPTCPGRRRGARAQELLRRRGLNSIGILTGGGLGRVLAHWIVNGRPDVDVTGFNIDRLHTYQATPSTAARAPSSRWAWSTSATTRRARCETARGAKKSPVHDRLVARGAYFRDVSGWEGPDWYAPPGAKEPTRWPAVVGPAELVPYWEAEHQARARA
jgi:glycine/D-amino acid oxidase-like deaminating enzyme